MLTTVRTDPTQDNELCGKTSYNNSSKTNPHFHTPIGSLSSEGVVSMLYFLSFSPALSRTILMAVCGTGSSVTPASLKTVYPFSWMSLAFAAVLLP